MDLKHKIKIKIQGLWFNLNWKYWFTTEADFTGWVVDVYKHRFIKHKYKYIHRLPAPVHPMCRCTVVPVVLPESILKNVPA